MLLDLWLQALNLPVGLAIVSNDRALLRQQLYRVRAEVKNIELDRLTIIHPEKEDELWIVHKDI